METENTRPMTAGELVGKANEWRVIDRRRSSGSFNSRTIIIYQRGEAIRPKFEVTESNWKSIDDYMVQVCNKNNEVWRRFDDLQKARDFLNEISDMILYEGVFFKTKQSAYFYKPFGHGIGRPKMSREKRDAIINCMIERKMSSEKTAKELGGSAFNFCKIMREEGYKFVFTKARNSGHWEKIPTETTIQ